MYLSILKVTYMNYNSAEEHSEMLSDVEVEVRPELPQKRGNDREYHLRTRRDQLEAELQVCNAYESVQE